MPERADEPPAKWTLYGMPVHRGVAIGIGAPLYLPTYGNPVWLDPRLFAQDEDEWQAIEYRMPTEPVEVIGIVRDLRDVPPVLAPYVRVVGWIVERAPDPPLPQVPVLLAPKLPPLLPPDATVVLDANAGVAYIEPSTAILARYQSQLLRTATHKRYHLESEHLPVLSWDGVRVQLGCVAADCDEAARAVQAGAELVWLNADALPNPITPLAHALGGKPLWWFDPHAAERDDTHWQHLLRASAELNLTLFVDAPDLLQEACDSLEVAREALRMAHAPIGALEVGLLWSADAALPRLTPSLPDALCWCPTRPTQSALQRLWTQQAQARRLGVRRALIVPDAEPETIALALGLEPHTLFVPTPGYTYAKIRLALLGVAECRDWLLQRLRNWRNPSLRELPAQWIAERSG